MTSITERLKTNHKFCDDKFHAFESAVENKHWEQSQTCWNQFVDAFENHIIFEEQILFPAFEKAANLSPDNGPTAVMRMEHKQFKESIKNIESLILAEDNDGLLDFADELMTQIQQHSMKEESIIYPLCDQHLSVSSFNFDSIS